MHVCRNTGSHFAFLHLRLHLTNIGLDLITTKYYKKIRRSLLRWLLLPLDSVANSQYLPIANFCIVSLRNNTRQFCLKYSNGWSKQEGETYCNVQTFLRTCQRTFKVNYLKVPHRKQKIPKCLKTMIIKWRLVLTQKVSAMSSTAISTISTTQQKLHFLPNTSKVSKSIKQMS